MTDDRTRTERAAKVIRESYAAHEGKSPDVRAFTAACNLRRAGLLAEEAAEPYGDGPLGVTGDPERMEPIGRAAVPEEGERDWWPTSVSVCVDCSDRFGWAMLAHECRHPDSHKWERVEVAPVAVPEQDAWRINAEAHIATLTEQVEALTVVCPHCEGDGQEPWTDDGLSNVACSECNGLCRIARPVAVPAPREISEFVAAYDAWQVGKARADVDGDWLRIAPLYDAMVEARAALSSAREREPEHKATTRWPMSSQWAHDVCEVCGEDWPCSTVRKYA